MGCPICGGSSPEVMRVELTDPIWLDVGGDEERTWRMCDECTHLFVDPPPEQEALYAATQAWEAKTQLTPEELFKQAGRGHFDAVVSGHALERLLEMSNCVLHTPSLLDVGAGVGKGAIFAAKTGWDAVALERRQDVQSIYEHMGVPLISEDILRFDAKGKTWDVVWCEEVIEHMVDVAGLMERLSRWSHHVVYLTTPDAAWYPAWGPDIWGCVSHIHGFTPQSITHLAERCGLVVHEISYAWRTGMSMAVYCRIAGL